MGFFDLFKKKKKDDTVYDGIHDLTLDQIKVGFFLDYDLKTWEVTSYATYDWGHGDFSYEWQIKSAREILYLERETGDEDEWSVSKKVPMGKLGAGIRREIQNQGDPPEEIQFEGRAYYLDESSRGRYRKNGKGSGHEFYVWDYEDDSGDYFLGIEQWDENDFEASAGFSADEYQFTNIIPGR